MLKFSTGLRNYMLTDGAFTAAMNLCFLKIYAGAVPGSADADLGAATLLCTVSNDATATGLTWESAAAAGVVSKTVAEVWRGVNVADGTATFFRLVVAGDDGTSSTSQRRVQGTIARVNADLLISDPVLISAASQDVNSALITLPTA